MPLIQKRKRTEHPLQQDAERRKKLRRSNERDQKQGSQGMSDIQLHNIPNNTINPNPIVYPTVQTNLPVQPSSLGV